MDRQKQRQIEEAKAELSERQLAFCHEYIIDWNGTRAAIAAGYSKKAASEMAYQNMKKHKITDYIKLIKNNVEKEAGITRLKVVQELKGIAFSDISDILEVDLMGRVFLKDGMTLSELPKEATKLIESVEPTKFGIKLKLVSKENAMAQLIKVMGYSAPDKVNVTGSLDTKAKIDYSELSPEALEEIVKSAQKNGLK